MSIDNINRFAGNEGWAIFECNNSHDLRGNVTPFQLQKDDEAAIFADDSDAWRHVVIMARMGSNLHLLALTFLRLYSPTEYTQIVKFVK